MGAEVTEIVYGLGRSLSLNLGSDLRDKNLLFRVTAWPEEFMVVF